MCSFTREFERDGTEKNNKEPKKEEVNAAINTAIIEYLDPYYGRTGPQITREINRQQITKEEKMTPAKVRQRLDVLRKSGLITRSERGERWILTKAGNTKRKLLRKINSQLFFTTLHSLFREPF